MPGSDSVPALDHTACEHAAPAARRWSWAPAPEKRTAGPTWQQPSHAMKHPSHKPCKQLPIQGIRLLKVWS